ncbi:IS6 family transposase [Caloramator sp. E03]|uniref:IS6 family transposase n=1 Tax=Caloramator sp. E03 TaxID=2576307 RepID=UPI0011104190|nr:IS6 family transposase [Caloramator sp. E03]QCX33330.1 IS6 family transposase [Caloramator sp. E03]
MCKSLNKISCPRCHSQNLYRFGKDKAGNQKYQCKDCRRQFTLEDYKGKKNRVLRGYPRCPVCGSGTYLHHDYEYYSHYTCNSKKCGHSIYVAKPINIPSASCELIKGKTDFKRMRFPLFLILTALNLYYLNGSSTRRISQFFKLTYNVKVSHVTIASWCKKFAPIFLSIANKLTENLDLSASDEWHADETVVFINGKKHYIWLIIDSETRMVLGFNLSPSRDASQAFSLFKSASKFGCPSAIVTDRLGSYNLATKTIFNSSKHIKVQSFKDDISNNLLEAFNDTFKDWYKRKRGFKSFESANTLIAMFIFHYNFLRPHYSLNNLTPAQVAGILVDEKNINNWLLSA